MNANKDSSEEVKASGNSPSDQPGSNKLFLTSSFLNDDPTEQDYLAENGDVGPHKRVAIALAGIVKSSEDEGGKLIGLQGRWGEGKTSVIRMLEKELASEKVRISVFSFDAWAHEGDPLRRTFLESLIRHFQSNTKKWINNDKWNGKIEKLANRKIDTQTITSNKVTILGKIFALSILFVPLGVAFLRETFQDVTFSWGGTIHVAFMFGLIFFILPFGVLVGNLLLVMIKISISGETDSTEVKNIKSKSWAFLTGEYIQSSTQNTSQTPEPTSIEFEEHFRALMSEALGENSQRKIVIVLDNLDRIDQKDALSIWSTLQTFLQYRGRKSDKWFLNIWIIVPYDPNGLFKIWDKDNSAGEFPASNSFIEKSFQIIFSVPPLVLSNWKNYLVGELLAKAFPDHSADRLLSVYRVYKQARKEDKPPTPRQLKLFVNQLVVLYRQWGEIYPLDHIAYFVQLSKDFQTDISVQLREGILPESKISRIASPKLRMNLAGLVFNVNANLGQQLLLGEDINNALAKRDPTELNKIYKNHKEGFWAVLDDVVTIGLIDSNTDHICSSSMTLAAADWFNDTDRLERLHIIDGIEAAVQSIGPWKNFDLSQAEGLADAFKLINKEATTSSIVSRLRIQIGLMTDEAVEDIRSIVEGIIHLLDNIKELGHISAVDEAFKLSVDPGKWVSLCSVVSKTDSEWWMKFKLNLDPNKFVEYLVSELISSRFSQDHFDSIKVTMSSTEVIGWAVLTTAIKARFAPGASIDPAETELLLRVLLYFALKKEGNAQAILTELSSEGMLLDRFHHVNAAGDRENIARLITTIAECDPSFGLTKNIGNSVTGHQTLEKLLNEDNQELAKFITNILKDDNKTNLLFNIIDTRNSACKLINRCLIILASESEPEKYYSPDNLVSRWELLRTCLSEDQVEEDARTLFESLAQLLCERSGLIEYIVNGEDRVFNPADSELYIILRKFGASSDADAWYIEGLEGVDIPTWKEHLLDGNSAIGLLIDIRKEDAHLTLSSTNLQDALVDYALDILEERLVAGEWFQTNKESVFNCLSSGSARPSFRGRLLDQAINNAAGCKDSYLDLFGDEISDYETLLNSANLVPKLFSTFLLNSNIRGLNWVKNVLDLHPKLLKEHPNKSATANFKDRVQTIINNKEPDGELDEVVGAIAKLLGVKEKKESGKSKPTEDG